jgi:hypothetical protein
MSADLDEQLGASQVGLCPTRLSLVLFVQERNNIYVTDNISYQIRIIILNKRIR